MNAPRMPPSPVAAAPRELGRPLAGWRLRLYTVIFEADTRAGPVKLSAAKTARSGAVAKARSR